MSVHEVVTTPLCVRYFSEKTQKYQYKPIDSKQYFADYRKKNRKFETCSICDKVVFSQMTTHQKGLKCKFIALNKQIEIAQNDS